MITELAENGRSGAPVSLPLASGLELVGRQSETSQLAQLVNDVKGGVGRSLLYLGAAGVGKTRLLAEVREHSGLRVVRLAGMESEAGLDYAAAQRLLSPFAHRLDEIEEPQRDAIRASVSGIRCASPRSRLMVGLGALCLITADPRKSRYLFLVDNAHWIDDESLCLIGFLARRAATCGVGFVIAGRDGYPSLKALSGLPGKFVTGLSAGDAATLLARASATSVGRSVAARIAVDTDGNPRALIELAQRLTREQLEGRSPLPGALPTWPGLDSDFLHRARSLPISTQGLLVLISAMSAGDRSSLWDAAALLRIPRESAYPAQRLGILTGDDHATFARPLVRASAYNSADPVAKRAAHIALASVAEFNGDSDLSAWHRAALTEDPDEQKAMDLETNADRAAQRGGPANRALFLGKAAELSGTKSLMGLRLFGAARAYLAAGNSVLAEALLGRATQWLDAEAFYVDTCRLRAAIDASFGRPGNACVELVAAIGHADPTDRELVRGLINEAFDSAILAGRYATGIDVGAIAERIIADPPPAEAAPAGRDALLVPLAVRMTGGYEQAAPLLAQAVRSLFNGEGAASSSASSSVVALGCLAADDLWDDAARSSLLTRAATIQNAHESTEALRVTLAYSSVAHAWSGDIGGARRAYDAAARPSGWHDTSGAPTMGADVQIQALLGNEQSCRMAAAETMRWAVEHDCEVWEMVAMSALAVLEIGLGNYSAASAHSMRVMESDLPGSGSRILPEVVEACVRTGQTHAALVALERLRSRAIASGTPWALGLLHRSEGLLTHDGEEARFLAAISSLSLASVQFDTARAHLLYGEWLRRKKRRIDAQTQLRIAHDSFTAMSAAGFAHRSYCELLAAGYPPAGDHGPAYHGLTPQEAQVAHFAASGATNAEIAETMCLTRSTIEYHLNKVFRKVGVSSRRQLAKALTGTSAENIAHSADRRPREHSGGRTGDAL